MSATKWILTAAFAALLAAPAPAAFITSLYGTGLNDDGSVRTNFQSELHYTLLGGEIPVTPVVFDDAHGFPIPPWLDDASSATSRWITPSTATSVPAGTYTFTTTFDLTGFAPGTATITGKWATDNGGLDILLNETPLGITSNSFVEYTLFAIPAGNPAFLPGSNTLTFILFNGGEGDNPAGLRVELTGTADSVATPLPPTALLAVFGLGAAGLRSLVRRRRG